MKLHLPVTKVEQDIIRTAADRMTKGGKVQRFQVTLSDGYDSNVTYSTAVQPAVGEMLTVEITRERDA